jgi:hypothetical protein
MIAGLLVGMTVAWDNVVLYVRQLQISAWLICVSEVCEMDLRALSKGHYSTCDRGQIWFD